MTRRSRSPFLPLLALSLCAALAWAYFTPYFALRKLQAAAESGDAKTLSAMVDFAAVRTSLKDEVRTGAARGVTGERRGAFAQISGLVAGSVAGAVADPLVNTLVTPTGVSLLVQGRTPGDRRPAEGRGWRDDVRIERGYEGPNRFLVRYADAESGEARMALVLTREGLGWRLTGVRLGGGR
jgi:hypothetical protein